MEKAVTVKTLERTVEKKAADAGADIALINAYSLKELAPEEVFVFALTLCDNQIDRDSERFDDECLAEFAPLFEGKTGIFNHQWDARGQVARIYSAEVESDDSVTRLRARAYIARGVGADDVIAKIEAGILKEVSVGFSIGRTECSICGKDVWREDCPHYPGREYEGELCVGILKEARDAYEFSFVAVPAQREAGVTKKLREKEAMEKAEAQEQQEPEQQEAGKTINAAQKMTAALQNYIGGQK